MKGKNVMVAECMTGWWIVDSADQHTNVRDVEKGRDTISR
jgi:hypothetical protein